MSALRDVTPSLPARYHRDRRPTHAKRDGDCFVANAVRDLGPYLADLIFRQLGSCFALIGARLRTEFTLAFPRQIIRDQELAPARSAREGRRAHTHAVCDNKQFLVADTSGVISSCIAWLTCWNKVTWAVVSAIVIHVVGDELAHARLVAVLPINWPAAPMTRMRAWAESVEQHFAMFMDVAARRREGMPGGANAAISVIHQVYFTRLVAS